MPTMVIMHKHPKKKLNKVYKALAAYAKKRQFVQKKAQRRFFCYTAFAWSGKGFPKTM